MTNGNPEDRIITVVVLQPSTEGSESLVAALSENKYCEVIKVESPQEAVQLAVQSQPCLVVTSFVDQSTIMNSMVFLKGIHGLTKRGRIKSVVVSKLKSPKLRAASQKLMVSEFMEEPVPARTIQFKANIQIKAVDAIKKKDAELRAKDQKVQLKRGEMKKAKQEYDSQASMKPQLGVKNDAFTFKGAQVKKKNNGKTNFNLGGPDPASGDWVEHESEEEGKTAWRWVPNDEEEKKAAGGEDGKDGWVAEGEKPKFNEAKKKWEFEAEKPRVYQRKDGKAEAEKVRTNEEGELEVAEDSEEATEKVNKSLKAIEEREEAEKKDPRQKGKKPESEESGDKNKKVKRKPASKEERLKNLLGDDDDEETEFNGLKESNEEDGEHEKRGFDLENQLDEGPGKTNETKDGRTEDEETAKDPKKNKEKIKPQKGSLKDRLLDGEDDSDDVSAGDLNDKRSSSAEEEIEKNDKREKADDEIGKDKKEKIKPKKNDLKDRLIGEDDDEADDSKEASAGDLVDKRSKDNADKLAGLRDRLGEDENMDENEAHENLNATAGRIKEAKKSGFDVNEQIKKSQENAKEKKLAELKKKLIDAAKKEAAKPIPKELSDEERKEAEKELGVAEGELSDEDLAKKRKKEKLKKMMDKMKELDAMELNMEDEKKGAFNVHDIKKEDPTNTQSQKNEANTDQEGGGWGARDSDQEGDEVEWKGHKSDSEKTDSKIKKKKSDRVAFYISEEELNVEGAAWEHSENYFICVGPEIKYRGFKEIAELLPIWIFNGEDKPEFLDKDKRWRFYEKEATKVESLADLPLEVSDFLNAMNDQLKSGLSQEPKVREKEEALQEAEEKRDDAKDRLAALKASLEEDPEPTPEEAAEEGFDLAEFKAQKKAQITQDHDELEAELAELEAEVGSKKQEFIETVEETIEASEEGDPLYEEKKKRKASKNRPKEEQAEEKPAEEEEPKSTASQLEEKMKSSEAADFLANRKKRSEKLDKNGAKIGSAHAAKAKEIEDKKVNITETPKSDIDNTIAIDLLLSDAIFDGRDIINEPEKLLNTISDRFGNAKSSLVKATSDEQGEIILSSDKSLAAGEAWEFKENPKTPEKEFLNEKLISSDTNSILGFLNISPLAPRRSFTADDEKIIESIGKSISDFWTSTNRKNKKKDEAA